MNTALGNKNQGNSVIVKRKYFKKNRSKEWMT